MLLNLKKFAQSLRRNASFFSFGHFYVYPLSYHLVYANLSCFYLYSCAYTFRKSLRNLHQSTVYFCGSLSSCRLSYLSLSTFPVCLQTLSVFQILIFLGLCASAFIFSALQSLLSQIETDSFAQLSGLFGEAGSKFHRLASGLQNQPHLPF